MKKYSVLLASLLAIAAVTACEKKAPAPAAPAPATAPADTTTPATAPTPAPDASKPADPVAPMKK